MVFGSMIFLPPSDYRVVLHEQPDIVIKEKVAGMAADRRSPRPAAKETLRQFPAAGEQTVRDIWRGSAGLALLATAVIVALVLSCGGRERPGSPRQIIRLIPRLADSIDASHPTSLKAVHAVLGRDLRPAIEVDSPAVAEFFFDRLHHDRLRVSVGSKRKTRGAGLGEPARVDFIIRSVELGGEEVELARRRVELEAQQRESTWTDLEVDLTRLAGNSATLELLTEFDQAAVSAYWAAPVLYRAEPPSTLPNVILISIDTLGINHTSLHGYERDTTPNLERFARDAVVFDQAITHQSWTLTAHASLLTSLHVDTHRVSKGTALPETAPLLPNLLQDTGYLSIGIVNNPWLDPIFGYGRAYDRYDYSHERKDANGDRIKRNIEETNELVDSILADGLPSPFFLFYHVIDPHSDWRELPYEAPEPFGSRYIGPGPQETVAKNGPGGSRFLGQVNKGEAALTATQLEHVRALYDGGVAYTDRHFGNLLELLDERGLYEDTLIVVTSDHGEEFLEHGKMMHTQAYDHTLRVPLLMKLPDGRGRGTRVARQVQLIDVMPTILEALDLAVPSTCEGQSLLALVDGRETKRRPAISKGRNFSMTPRDTYAVRDGNWKLIWRLESGMRELYDLRNDPDETRDLSGTEPERLATMTAFLESHRAARSQGYRLRVPAYSTEESLEVLLTTDSSFTNVFRYDQNPIVKRRSRLSIGSNGREIRLLVPAATGRGARAVGIDFQLAPGATSFALAVQADGKSLGANRIRLGSGRQADGPLPIRLKTDSALLSLEPGASVPFERPTNSALVFLWQSRGLRGREIQLDDEERSALRALGYLD